MPTVTPKPVQTSGKARECCGRLDNENETIRIRDASANARLSANSPWPNNRQSGGRAGSPDRSGHGAWGRRARSHRAAKVARHRRRTGNACRVAVELEWRRSHRRARRHRQAPCCRMSHLGVSVTRMIGEWSGACRWGSKLELAPAGRPSLRFGGDHAGQSAYNSCCVAGARRGLAFAASAADMGAPAPMAPPTYN